MKRYNNHSSGFTLLEITLVVAVVGLLSSIAIPNFVKARASNRKSVCITYLRQMENAKALWAQHTGKNGSSIPADSDLFGSEGYIRLKPACPDGGSYTISSVDSKVRCTLAETAGHTL